MVGARQATHAVESSGPSLPACEKQGAREAALAIPRPERTNARRVL